ncbi:hypothetical protein VTL71DRAFT_10857 [Oculimacula yallundae]|uniref:Uncharacterized protein n=1 Tax=Oculimacula yallundae TaxID=86028 RepID=A0ABR4CWH9_9HELO
MAKVLKGLGRLGHAAEQDPDLSESEPLVFGSSVKDWWHLGDITTYRGCLVLSNKVHDGVRNLGNRAPQVYDIDTNLDGANSRTHSPRFQELPRCTAPGNTS